MIATSSLSGERSVWSPQRALVIVLDALPARFGGTAYAVVQLTAALERRDDVAQVVVIAQRGSIVGQATRLTARVAPLLLDAPVTRFELAWRLAWETLRLPSVIERHGADMLVSFSGMMPRRPPCAVVCVLANPVPYADPRRLLSYVRRIAMRRTRRFAVASYVPSTGMQALVGSPPAKVVPLGVDREVFRPQETPGDELLYVADFYAHKRHDLVLDAWQRLAEPRPRLRLVGNPEVDPRTFAAVRRAATDERIALDGQVSLPALLAAYGAARAVLLSSERESFSMPLAEAIASGIPAVIRDDPVLRETAGRGALVVPEATPEAWADALARIVADDELHATLREAGLRHGERFSWDAMAAELVADARRGA